MLLLSWGTFEREIIEVGLLTALGPAPGLSAVADGIVAA
jgi:hypothetical protein